MFYIWDGSNDTNCELIVKLTVSITSGVSLWHRSRYKICSIITITTHVEN